MTGAQAPTVFAETPCIPASGLPSAFLQMAAMRGHDPLSLLAGTGLFAGDWVDPQRQMSPVQFERLLTNLVHAQHGEDMAFLVGARHAQMADAPLWSPVVWQGAGATWIALTGSQRGGDLPAWQAEAFAGMMRERLRPLLPAGTALQFYFRHAMPRYLEQYHAHLGENLTFSAPANLIRADAYVDLLTPPAVAFLCRLRALLDTSPPADLPLCAAHFGFSVATMKRRLKAQGTHFQQQLDEARRLQLLRAVTAFGDPATAPQPTTSAFSTDPSNRNREQRRLTGLTALQLRHLLIGYAGERVEY